MWLVFTFMCNKLKTYFVAVFFIALIFPKNVFAQVVINEFVVDGSPEWVEFHNASGSAEYLKQYFIDDDEDFNNDSGNSGKKSLSNINISSINYPYYDLSSAIFNNSSSDYVVLFDQLGNVIDSYSYEESPGKDISIGRSPDGSGDFFVLQSLTKGSGNALPVPSPTPIPTPTSEPTETPQPTDVPTPQPPSSTPVPISTPKLTSTPKPTPSLSPTPTLTEVEEVLGTESAESALDENSTPEGKIKKGKFSFWPFVFIIPGLGMISFSVLLLRKQKI